MMMLCDVILYVKFSKQLFNHNCGANDDNALLIVSNVEKNGEDAGVFLMVFVSQNTERFSHFVLKPFDKGCM